MSIGKNIKRLREKHGLSQLELAKKINVSDKAVSTWENDIKVPRMGSIQRMADLFDVVKSDIIEEQSDNIFSIPNIIPIPEMETVPLIGTIACGVPILAEENITDYLSVEKRFQADFALTCRGDSMINARIFDGDIVFIRKQSIVDNGEIAAVLINSEATLKRVYIYTGRVILMAENPTIAPMEYEGKQLEDIRIIGKAVAFASLIR